MNTKGVEYKYFMKNGVGGIGRRLYREKVNSKKEISSKNEVTSKNEEKYIKKAGRAGYRNMADRIGQYGYKYSRKGYIGLNAIMILVTMITGVIYRMQWWGILAVMMVVMLCLPVLMVIHYECKYNERRFNEVDVYIHQMAYSFQRQPKINQALEDTGKVVGGRMKECVEKALDELVLDSSEKVYERALGIIEKEYNNSRITTLHKFIVNVEKTGGQYNNSLNVLVMDFDSWVKRGYSQQQKVARTKNNILIGIVISYVLAAASVMISAILKNTAQLGMDISHEPLYQIVAMVFLICNMLFYVWVSVMCKQDWLEKGRKDRCIIKDYDMAFHMDMGHIRKISIPLYAVVLAGALLLAAIRLYVWAVAAVMLLVYLIYVPVLNRKKAMSRVIEDVYVGFSDWLRDVSLNLQGEPLQMAIEDTYDTCPVVMKESLEQFIYDIESNPSDVTPYYRFMEMFQIPDISATVKTLYTISELGNESADETINGLIKRNYQFIDEHQKEKNGDAISVMTFMEYIPTLFVSMKVAVDMLLVITNYL